MLERINYVIIICLVGLISQSAFSQLVTGVGQTPQQLVQNVLAGNGVTVSNVNYTGHPEAIGTFNGTNTNLGLTNGIILTTGTILSNTGPNNVQEGPHGPNNLGNSGVDNNTNGYAPLTSIAGDNTFNATILEFDFVPNSDSVRFRYVFGSEEYPEFVNAGFNDVFAFFISGPGFGGVYNMATIPGTNGTPVTIDNVNANTNANYFIDNGDGTTAPENSSNFYIQYDGFTVVIEAVAQVQCGETYHLQMAIADVGDGVYDSGIFLEANSLVSYSPVEINANLNLNAFGDNKTMAEGCETSIVTVSRNSNNVSQALNIPLTTGGTATAGVDYTNIPSSINFGPGQSTVSFPLDIIQDNITEGDETIILILDQPDPCGNSNFIELELIIREVPPLQIQMVNDTVHCSGDVVVLQPNVSGGLPNFNYLYTWSTGETTPSINHTANQTETISVIVEDDCNSTPVTATIDVMVPIYDPIGLLSSNDTSVLCPNTPISLFAQGLGGDGNYSYQWTANGLSFGSGNSKQVAPLESSTYTVSVSDGCNDSTGNSIEVIVLTPLLTISIDPEHIICSGDEAVLTVTPNGGLGNFTYLWTHSGETTQSVTVQPEHSTEYIVHVGDECATYTVSGKTFVKVTKPRAAFSVLSSDPMEGLPVSFRNNSSGATEWIWNFGNGDISDEIVPNVIYSPWGQYEVQLIAISEIGCTDTMRRTIFIKPEFYFYAPNAFTPDNDRYNNEYRVSVIGATQFHFLIYNRWGELIFESYDPEFSWDGRYGGEKVPDDVYIFKCQVEDKVGYRQEFQGMITVLK